MEESTVSPFWHPKNIAVGPARAFWGSERYIDRADGWWTPGRFVRDRAEAERICKAMAEMMKSERPALGRGN